MEHIKAIAVRCLIDSGIQRLPVDVLNIRNTKRKWEILSYTEGMELLISLNLLIKVDRFRAFAIKTPKGKYMVFYDDSLSYADRNYYIAHEIGHIVLDHTVTGLIIGKSEDPETENAQEQEADIFALYLLAPSTVLAQADVVSIRDISRCTTISERHAGMVSREVASLKSYVQTPEEAKLCIQFRPFIWNRKLFKLKRLGIVLLAMLSTAALAYLLYKDIFVDAPHQYEIEVSTSRVVYVSEHGTKFHLQNCPTIQNSKVAEITIKEAMETGYGECQRCHPTQK